jgi:hypothetical protein
MLAESALPLLWVDSCALRRRVDRKKGAPATSWRRIEERTIIDNLLGSFSRLPRDILDEDIGGVNAITSIGGCNSAHTHLILYQLDTKAAESEVETVTTPASIRPLRNVLSDDEAVCHSHRQNGHRFSYVPFKWKFR